MFEFVKRIQKRSTKQNSIMISFDVNCLFSNISADFVIYLILNKIYVSNLSKTVQGLTKRQFRTLIFWTIKRTAFNFNGNSYDQIDGVALGSLLAPTSQTSSWIEQLRKRQNSAHNLLCFTDTLTIVLRGLSESCQRFKISP